MPKGYIEYQDRIGSQHELTTPGNRKSDVVISAIEKCEKLEKQLGIAFELLKNIEAWFTGLVGTLNNECAEHNKSVPVGNFEYAFRQHAESINKALKQIKELDK